MKFGNKKILATIVAVAVATGFTGCSKDENSSVQGDSDTEKDLLTSSSSIDIWSAQESIDSSLNSHDTSKPIEPTQNGADDADASVSDDGGTSESENPAGDNVSSDLTDDGDSSLADDKSDNGTSDSDKSDSTGETSKSETSSSGETSSSTGETSKPSDNTTSVPSDSSLADGTSDSDSSNSSANSSTSSDDKDSSANSSSSSNTAPWSDMPATITIPDGAVGEYFDVNGNPMPDDFDPNEGGFYDKKGRYHTSAEEYEAMLEAMRIEHEAIKNGDRDAYGNVTEEGADDLYKIFFGT